MNVPLASKAFPSPSNAAGDQLQSSKRDKATIDDAMSSSKNKNLNRNVDEPHEAEATPLDYLSTHQWPPSLP
uniref:Uncharacterized protein n=1 Tax=Leersia perrieri TaxID=77586 RepID=A0A0D9X6Z5_9ORYZ